MTIDELDRTYRRNAWLIAVRSGKAGAKGSAFGEESLGELADEIAGSYGIDPDERRRLAPTPGVAALDVARRGLTLLDDYAGVLAGLKVANDARRSGRLRKTGKAFFRGGMEAAATESRKAPRNARRKKAAAGGGVPIVAIARTVHAVGSACLFAVQARRFNLACHALAKARLGEATAGRGALPRSGGDDSRRSGPNGAGVEPGGRIGTRA